MPKIKVTDDGRHSAALDNRGAQRRGENNVGSEGTDFSIVAVLKIANPDARTLEKLQAAGYAGFADAPEDIQAKYFIDSANEVFAELEAALTQGQTVGVETVLSSDKYRALVEIVEEREGIFGLIYVGLGSPEISRERIAARVRRGGHGVPGNKLAVRWQRSLDSLGWFVRRATVFIIVDNSNSDPTSPLALLASGKNGRLHYLAPDAFSEMKVALAAIPLAAGPSP
ncbi:MAG TPA: hypothetical protein VN641_05280 [Urbifossiella sp.]|nr:hypothetical protein [Urbifossiella sp.]